MERKYQVFDGHIQTRSLEAHIVDHCNLTCLECCSLSPLLPARFVDTQALSRDLTLAAKVLAPRIFKLVGGEPLLHPDLPELLACVRASGIARELSVTTSGLLLGRMPDAFWQRVDALTVSLYPRPRLAPDLIAHIEAQSARFGVRVNWKTQHSFVNMTRHVPSSNDDDTRMIYHDCWLRERCHMIRDGIFYTCTRPAHFATLHRDSGEFDQDGIALHDEPQMLNTLLTYLQREQPLRACFHCHGGSATLQPHRLMTRAEVNQFKQVAQ
jgi:hypothetical protein